MRKIKVTYDREHDIVSAWIARHGKSGTAGYGPVGDLSDDEFEDIARWIASGWFVPLVEDLLNELKGPLRDAVRRGRGDA